MALFQLSKLWNKQMGKKSELYVSPPYGLSTTPQPLEPGFPLWGTPSRLNRFWGDWDPIWGRLKDEALQKITLQNVFIRQHNSRFRGTGCKSLQILANNSQKSQGHKSYLAPSVPLSSVHSFQISYPSFQPPPLSSARDQYPVVLQAPEKGEA